MERVWKISRKIKLQRIDKALLYKRMTYICIHKSPYQTVIINFKSLVQRNKFNLCMWRFFVCIKFISHATSWTVVERDKTHTQRFIYFWITGIGNNRSDICMLPFISYHYSSNTFFGLNKLAKYAHNNCVVQLCIGFHLFGTCERIRNNYIKYMKFLKWYIYQIKFNKQIN